MNAEKIRIAVLVSGGGTNLQALINAQSSGIISYGEIVLVLSSNPDAYALERAKKAGISGVTVEKRAYITQAEFEEKLACAIDASGAELIVLAGFMCILSQSFTARYAGRIVNVHPSLIPSFCGKGFYGLRVHEAALAYGVTVTGATVHFVNEVPDGGKIIMQKAVNVQEGDTPEVLQKRVMEEAEWIILPQAVETVCEKLISARANER